MKRSAILLLTAFAFNLLLILGLIVYINKEIKENTIRASGVSISDVRLLDKFDKINVSGGIEVLLKQDAIQNVTINVDENYKDLIKTEVRNGTLTVQSKVFFKAFNAKLEVSIPHISEINLMGGSQLKVADTIYGKDLTIILSGGCTGKAYLNYEQLEVQVSAGSIIELAGTAENSYFNVNAGSSLMGADLVSDTCHIEANSGSRADIYVSGFLSGSAFAGASVNYYGTPKLGRINTSAGGSITKTK